MKKLLLIALLFCLKQLNAQCSLTITGNTVICAGSAATLTASGASNYTWQPSGSNASSITDMPTTNTVYTVTGTTGTCTATNTVAVTVNPLPTMTVTSPPPYCPGNLISSTDYNITTNPSGVTYNWTATNHANTGMPANGTGAAPSSSYNAPPNSSLVKQVSVISYTPSLNGCVGTTVTETVTIKPTPFVDPVPPSFYCPNQVTNPVNFTCQPAGGTPIFIYTVPGGIGQTGTGSVPSYTIINNGTSSITETFTVSVTLNGCVGPNSMFSIMVFPNPVAKFSASMRVCEGQAMQFTDLSKPDTGQIIVNYWAWDFNNDGNPDSTTQNPSYIYPIGSAGTNSVTLYIGTSSAPSCIAQVTAPVYINPNPVADFIGDSLQGCSPLQTAFIDQTTISTGHLYYWNWIFGNGDTLYQHYPQSHVYTNSSTTQNAYFTVSLTVKSDSGCVNTITKTNYVEVLACAGNGIEKYNASIEVSVYPNPNNGNFVIETTSIEKQTLQIVDVTGKLILQQTINGKTIIDASSLDNGIYFVQLNISEGFYSKKIIVQH
jgi:PKD repeat protein